MIYKRMFYVHKIWLYTDKMAYLKYEYLALSLTFLMWWLTQTVRLALQVNKGWL